MIDTTMMPVDLKRRFKTTCPHKILENLSLKEYTRVLRKVEKDVHLSAMGMVSFLGLMVKLSIFFSTILAIF